MLEKVTNKTTRSMTVVWQPTGIEQENQAAVVLEETVSRLRRIQSTGENFTNSILEEFCDEAS
jgi:hypothetical protein